MKNIEDLNNSSVDELLRELKDREKKPLKSVERLGAGEVSLRATPLESAGIPWQDQASPSTKLSKFDTKTIVKALISKEKSIYDVDDRKDLFELHLGKKELDNAESVVALFLNKDITDNGDGTSTLKTQIFGEKKSLCAEERFWHQPVGAWCSGFLATPDIIVTAGHCVCGEPPCGKLPDVTDLRFVFGFRMRDATTPVVIIKNYEIYRGVELIDREFTGGGTDWAVIRIDRPVTNHPVTKIRQTGKINDAQTVYVIGHPVGLPAKFAGGATVQNNRSEEYFVANLDTFGGNSGSPVFNSDTHEVEGILVRGATDFVHQDNCWVARVFPDTGEEGEDCTRTSEFSHCIK